MKLTSLSSDRLEIPPVASIPAPPALLGRIHKVRKLQLLLRGQWMLCLFHVLENVINERTSFLASRIR